MAMSRLADGMAALQPLKQRLLNALSLHSPNARARILKRSTLSSGLAACAVGLAYYAYKQSKPRPEYEEYKEQTSYTKHEAGKTGKRHKVAVDKEFIRRLKKLLRIVLPGIASKEAFLLALHTMFLLARTFVSIYVASLDGSIVVAIVDRDAWAFFWRVIRWLLIAIPATYINSMIRYLEAKLAIAFRTRLVDHVYRQYMQNETYYRVDNVDSRIKNADQCLTEDVSRFCADLAHLYSQISKPCFDIVLMCSQLYMLARSRSGKGAQIYLPYLLAGGVLSFTGYILRASTPPFGKLVAEEARRYGHLRAVHARLITHAEEVAFYGGQHVEESALRRAYNNLVTHMNYILRRRIFYTMLEQFLMKYVWGASGLIMIAIPTLIRDTDRTPEVATVGGASQTMTVRPTPSSQPIIEDTVSTRTQDFVTARGLLISAADAMERLLSSWKEVTELAGRTARVAEMIDIFNDVSHGTYVKHVSEEAQANLSKTGEVIESSDMIECDRVPVVTPNGDLLVKELSFRITPGMHLLITGPNGCGKSSLFRMIGGLWAVHGGRLVKPSQGDMFYIPQRPYLSEGTLREQFIYPDTHADMKAKGITDDDLLKLLDVVHLQHVVTREGGWDAVNDWRDVLSGGEKQRVGMARVFYHKPKYAILDECTSAVSIDVEGRMYLHAKAIGITLMTVTHRPSLWKYHTHLLQFDGQGGYSFAPLNAEARLSLQEEKAKLESSLAGMPAKQARLAELCMLLGESSLYAPSGEEGAEAEGTS